MNNGSCIIDKIKGDAEKIASDNIADAEAKAEVIAKTAESVCEKRVTELKNSAADIENEIISRRKTVAQIDAKKVILNRKAEIIEKAYERAIAEMAKDTRYKNFLIGMLNEYAEDGDVVVVNKADGAVVSESVVSKIAKSKNIRLTKSSEDGDFAGGMMLLGYNADKNLTLESIIKSLKDELASDIADIAFGRL